MALVLGLQRGEALRHASARHQQSIRHQPWKQEDGRSVGSAVAVRVRCGRRNTVGDRQPPPSCAVTRHADRSSTLVVCNAASRGLQLASTVRKATRKSSSAASVTKVPPPPTSPQPEPGLGHEARLREILDAFGLPPDTLAHDPVWSRLRDRLARPTRSKRPQPMDTMRPGRAGIRTQQLIAIFGRGAALGMVLSDPNRFLKRSVDAIAGHVDCLEGIYVDIGEPITDPGGAMRMLTKYPRLMSVRTAELKARADALITLMTRPQFGRAEGVEMLTSAPNLLAQSTATTKDKLKFFEDVANDPAAPAGWGTHITEWSSSMLARNLLANKRNKLMRLKYFLHSSQGSRAGKLPSALLQMNDGKWEVQHPGFSTWLTKQPK